jgi:hypothetical protein
MIASSHTTSIHYCHHPTYNYHRHFQATTAPSLTIYKAPFSNNVTHRLIFIKCYMNIRQLDAFVFFLLRFKTFRRHYGPPKGRKLLTQRGSNSKKSVSLLYQLLPTSIDTKNSHNRILKLFLPRHRVSNIRWSWKPSVKQSFFFVHFLIPLEQILVSLTCNLQRAHFHLNRTVN